CAGDERDFDYVEGSKKGPAQWGEIKNEWAAWKSGGLQSPIDLSDQRVQIVPNLGELKINHKPSNATLKNRGHDIKLRWVGDAGLIEIDSIEYFLQQAHWHSPSDHLINGKRYDMELHMVYASPDPKVQNSIVVVGVLYEIGRPDSFLSKLMKDVALMTNQKAERSIGVIDPAQIIQLGGNKNYYRYVGSLTIPPCTEGVIWIISKQFGTVSKVQMNLLRVAVHDYAEMNARPEQPLNHREIQTSDNSARENHN
uniref:alpha carbonic anhydrase 7-like n=1 Tax=Fragaria vesca subsp. vesca TaxID=101020 RepID=UPI0005CB4E8E